jgi:hypothetical protein
VSQPVGYLFSRWNPSETNVPRGAGVGIAMAGQWKGAGGAELRSSGKRRAAGRAVDVNGKPLPVFPVVWPVEARAILYHWP